MNHKLRTIRDFLENENLDSILITSASNITYTSNFVARLSTEREAFVLITKQQIYIFTSKLYLEEVKGQSEAIAIELSVKTPLHTALKEIIEKERLKTVGFEEENLTYKEFEKLSKHILGLVPVDLYGVREIKDQAEIEKIAKACEIGDKTFEYILSEIRYAITEEDLALKMENFIRNHYAALSFPTIVAFGKNAAVAHHATGKTKLEKNQFVLLDFGVLFENYCSDMTRTVFFGKPTHEEKHAYETVKNAQEKAIEYITLTKTDISAKEADRISREHITSKGFPSYPHSLGHGIGIDVHEGPSLSPYSTDTLRAGMVFSIEPGIYIDHKLGIRIEDLLALEITGTRMLTNAPKELILV